MIDWAETGGPPVVKPTRRGFGSDLIERGLARQSGGTAVLEFNKEGVRCHIACMLPQRDDRIGNSPCRDPVVPPPPSLQPVAARQQGRRMLRPCNISLGIHR